LVQGSRRCEKTDNSSAQASSPLVKFSLLRFKHFSFGLLLILAFSRIGARLWGGNQGTICEFLSELCFLEEVLGTVAEWLASPPTLTWSSSTVVAHASLSLSHCSPKGTRNQRFTYYVYDCLGYGCHRRAIIGARIWSEATDLDFERGFGSWDKLCEIRIWLAWFVKGQ
jgi:hypothetical protein